MNAREREEVDDGWVHCCEWRYWGLRRVAQIALPYAPLSGSVPLLEGLAIDSLEVELSFVNPLTQTLEVRPAEWRVGVGDFCVSSMCLRSPLDLAAVVTSARLGLTVEVFFCLYIRSSAPEHFDFVEGTAILGRF